MKTPSFFTCRRSILPYLISTGSAFGVLTQETSINLDFVPPAESSEFYEQLANNTKIVTDAQTLEFRATPASEDTRFVLMSYNNQDYPVFSNNGQFSGKLDLLPGYNRLQLSAIEDRGQSLERQIIRITPARIVSVQVDSRSDSGEVSENLLQQDPSLPISTSIPSLMISGMRGQPEEVQIQARDQFGNPLVVDTRDEAFAVHYTLREGENSILIRSIFDDRTIDVQTLKFRLKNPIELEDLIRDEADPVIRRGSLASEYISQSLEVPIRGSVQAIAHGFVDLSVAGVSSRIPVKDHQFETIITLEPASKTQVKVSFTTENQNYFDHLQITHIAPEIKISGILAGMETNGNVSYAQPLTPSPEGIYTTRSPFFQLAGSISHFGALASVVSNLTTGEVVTLGDHAGDFLTNLRLADGENRIEGSIESQGHVLASQPIVVVYENTTAFSLKGLQQETDGTYVSANACITLLGTANGIESGRAKVQLDGRFYSAPIQNGRIDFEIPTFLSEGMHTISVAVETPGAACEQSFTLRYDAPVTPNIVSQPESVEVAQAEPPAPITTPPSTPPSTAPGQTGSNSNSPTLASDSRSSVTPNASSDSDTTDHPDTSDHAPGEFTPPKPIRTAAPKNVKDPENRRLDLTGSCLFEFVIGEDGTISRESISVIETTNELLNESGIEALTKWRFNPALLDGTPVEKRTRIKLSWN